MIPIRSDDCPSVPFSRKDREGQAPFRALAALGATRRYKVWHRISVRPTPGA